MGSQGPEEHSHQIEHMQNAREYDKVMQISIFLAK